MRKILALPVLLAVTACGVPIKASDPSLFTKSWDGSLSSSAIESELTRSTGAASPIVLDANPFTASLIESSETEKGQKRMSSEAEIKASIAQLKKELIENKTCFLFKLKTRSIGMGYFKYYTAKATNDGKDLVPITFINTKGVESVPDVAHGLGASGFENWTIGCTSKALDMMKPFRLFFANDAARIELGWEHAGTSKL
jgi:hypothetical protein